MKIVWTNGCFDILHPGHVELLFYAKSLGDKLIVGLDEDQRVKKSKGLARPINCLSDRMKIIYSIKGVDEVVSFGSDDELEKRILDSGASTIVVGSDYRKKRVIGSEIVDQVVFFEKLDEYSTTKTIKDIDHR